MTNKEGINLAPTQEIFPLSFVYKKEKLLYHLTANLFMILLIFK